MWKLKNYSIDINKNMRTMGHVVNQSFPHIQNIISKKANKETQSKNVRTEKLIINLFLWHHVFLRDFEMYSPSQRCVVFASDCFFPFVKLTLKMRQRRNRRIVQWNWNVHSTLIIFVSSPVCKLCVNVLSVLFSSLNCFSFDIPRWCNFRLVG